MKTVLLLGDSIRRGYDKSVKKTLKERQTLFSLKKTVGLRHIF